MDDDARPTRQQISAAVDPAGWCLILGAICAEVPASTLAEATEVAALAVSAAGRDGQGHLTVDIRADRAVLRLQSADGCRVTGRDIRLAHQVSGVLESRGWRPGPGTVQALEIAIDAIDIPLVRPFWKAVTGYVDEPGSELNAALIDPAGLAPAIWFQQMKTPRPQRNRIHLDVDVPHRAARARVDAAIAAGGRLLSDAAAPAFWVLADPEGNEACVCTWQGRD
ncbi:VOC family protein [Mycobacterium sp. NPDC048908]|uniref:VOC family protein n=1 Tax=Mycobacterium sp. NPDC048908 TaxID=3364292 RepID=UPI003721A6BB